MTDILLHTAALVVLTALGYAATAWLLDLELVQKQARHGNDFGSGWGHPEWAAALAACGALWWTGALPLRLW